MIGDKFFIEDDELAEKVDTLQAVIKGISDQVCDLTTRRGIYQREVHELVREAYPELSAFELGVRYSAGLGVQIEVQRRAFE